MTSNEGPRPYAPVLRNTALALMILLVGTTGCAESTLVEVADAGPDASSLCGGSVCGSHAACVQGACACERGYTGNGRACDPVSCPAQVLGNGTVTPPDVGTPGSKIAYGCNAGYTLSGGDASRTCRSDGSWDGTAPRCVPTTTPGCASDPCVHGTCLPGANGTYSCTPCEAGWMGTNCDVPVMCAGGLVPPANGSVDVTSASVGGVATYACDAGYTRNGATTVTCTDDGAGNGVWRGTAPTCDPIQCPTLPNPTNGSVLQPSKSLGSTAMYACDAGFVLGGAATRTCQTSASWSGLEPTCLTAAACSAHPCVHSAGCIDAGPGSPAYACGTCDAGWSGPNCDVPVVCSGANAPSHGFVSVASAMVDGTVTYGCDPGFLLSGTSARICQVDGSFSGVEPTCFPVTCNGATAPAHGTVSATTASYGAALTYTCDAGYVLAGGAATRTCQQDGSFSGLEPTCAPRACSPVLVAPTNGSVSTTNGVTGDVAMFGCDFGYVQSGPATRTCQFDGTWSGTSPTCDFVVAACTSNPCVHGSCTDAPGSAYTCACDPGYQGSNCDMPIDCSGYAAPANGSVSSPTTTFGMSVVYDCNAGYVLQGASTSTCEADGSLSGTPPVCVPITCLGANAPANGALSAPSVGFGDSVTYACNAGYVLSGNGGSATRTCLADGGFSGAEPTCAPAPCAPDLVTPMHGTVSQTSGANGDVATYACDPGYAAFGSLTTTCRADGTWSDPTPTCASVVDQCSARPCVHSALCTPVGLTDYDCGPCDPGWTGMNCDTPITCAGANAPVDGSVSASTAIVGDAITYACDPGYDLVGNASVTCVQSGANGTWSDPAPSCAPVTCSGATAPDHGSVSASSTTFGQSITYGCDPGYAFSGNGGLTTRTCQATGVFGGTAPTCVGFGTICDFTHPCQHGGVCTPKGPSPSGYVCTCTSGWTGTNCDQPATCSGLTSPTNGYVDRTDGVTGDVATYQCYSSYVLLGTSQRTCQSDGTWTGAMPTCARIQPGCIPNPCQNGGSCATSGPTMTPICACVPGYSGTNCETPVACTGAIAPANGDVSSSTINYPGSIVYACDVGYMLVGNATRACQSNGTFAGADPTCVPAQ